MAKLMTENSYQESIYNLNDNMSQMGLDNGSQHPQQEESIMGLLQVGANNASNHDTKSQVS